MSDALFSGWAVLGRILLVGVLAVVFLVSGVGEETGWRGFAVEHLLHEQGDRGDRVELPLAPRHRPQ